MKYKIQVIISLIFLLALPSFCFGKPDWQKVFTAPGRVSVIFFYDRYLGFVCIGSPGGNMSMTAIFRTTDGGTSWEKARMPSGSGCGINELIMVDRNNGWALGNSDLGNVLKTTDGGQSWNVVSKSGYAGSLGNSIRQTSQGLIVSDFASGNILLSADGGTTFRTIYHAPQPDWGLGLDFVDSLHGAAVTSFRSSNNWSYTSDGGLTWKPSNYRMESWSIRGMKGTPFFFAAPEGYSNTDNYLTDIMRSDDYGQNWHKLTTLSFRATSDVEIALEALYLQSGYVGCDHCTFPDGRGIFRSTDSGATWKGLGGPECWADTRFAAIPTCNGVMIVCADRYNNIYRGYDSTVVSVNKINAPFHTIVVPPKPIAITPCHTQFLEGSITIDECYRLIIQNETIEGKDSSLFSLLYSKYPLTLFGKKDSIIIPLTTIPDSGSYEAYLHITGYYDIGEGKTIPFDTLLPLKVSVSPAPPELIATPAVVTFRPISSCQNDHDMPLQLSNAGCDTLTIIAGPGEIAAPFFLDSLPLPFSLAPGASVIIPCHFYPDSAREYSGEAIFTARANDRIRELSVPLLGKRAQDIPNIKILPAQLSFGSTHVCDSAQVRHITIVNSGCDTVTITSLSQSSVSAFWLDSLSLPIVLPPDSSIDLAASFHPTFSGVYSMSLSVTASRGSNSVTASALLNATALPSPINLIAGSDSLLLPLRSTCEQALDSSISYTNSGCDTVIISSGPVLAPGGFSFEPVSYPVILAPGNTFSFRFHFHPTLSGPYSWTPEFIAERFAARAAIDVTITASAIEGVGILRSSIASIPFASLSICSGPDSEKFYLSNPGCDSLVITDLGLQGESSFSFSTSTLPFFLAPGDSITSTVYITARSIGLQSSAVVIKAHSIHGSRMEYDLAIPLSATITRGSRYLSVSADTINFGKRSICTNPDTIVTIQNSGCDTLIVFGAAISSKAFMLGSIPFPLILPPSSSITLPVLTAIDTSDNRLSSDALLNWSTNSDLTAPPILLHREYGYPQARSLGIHSTISTGSPGDTVTYQIFAEQAEGLQTIDLDITYDTDLLQWISAIGSNTIALSEGHLTITGHPTIVSENGMVATLLFSVFLSKQDSCSIAVSNPHINTATPQYETCTEVATPEISQCVFLSSVGCGGKTISSQLRKSPAISIKSIYPNPAVSAFTIILESPVSTAGTISLTDSYGRIVYMKEREFIAGTEHITIDCSPLPSGLYTLSLSSSMGSAINRIVIQR